MQNPRLRSALSRRLCGDPFAAVARRQGAGPFGRAWATVLAGIGLLLGPLAGLALAAEDGHGSLTETIAGLVNFVLLVGLLVYVLRSPLAAYLTSRIEQVKSDLVRAAEMRATATGRLADIERRLAGLPQHLETLRARGAQEVAEEEARIQQAAEAEKHRLRAQVHREIDLQVRVAKRLLLEEAADLTVGVAAAHLRRRLTDEEQARLVERYLGQVRAHGG